jgi:hypothetical protein
MRQLNGVYSQAFNRRHKRIVPPEFSITSSKTYHRQSEDIWWQAELFAGGGWLWSISLGMFAVGIR